MNKKKLLFFSIMFLTMNLFVFFVFFPTLPIYGYTHQISTIDNPELYITITSNTLFKVLKDDYYNNVVKFSYIISFILQITSVAFSTISMLLFALSKKVNHYILIIPSVIWSILLIILFRNTITLLIVSTIFFIMSISYFIYLLITKRNNGSIYGQSY